MHYFHAVVIRYETCEYTFTSFMQYNCASSHGSAPSSCRAHHICYVRASPFPVALLVVLNGRILVCTRTISSSCCAPVGRCARARAHSRDLSRRAIKTLNGTDDYAPCVRLPRPLAIVNLVHLYARVKNALAELWMCERTRVRSAFCVLMIVGNQSIASCIHTLFSLVFIFCTAAHAVHIWRLLISSVLHFRSATHA